MSDHPDKTAGSGMMSGDDKIEGLPTVDKSQKEGTVYFDIRFLVIHPVSGELLEIFINIEIQNDDTPGYPIPKRGIYYAARMISSQRGTVFKDQEYGKIKKSVSIWVCEGTADYRSDTINRYAFTEECLRGDFHEEKQAYDLMTVVVLRLGKKGVNSGDNAIRLLSKMFSMDLDYEEKLDALENEFQISTSKEISEEVQEVCNLSTGVFNKAYDKGYGSGYDSGYDSGYGSGYDSGYDSGVSAGMMKQKRDTTYELYDMGMSGEQIAKVVKVSIDTIQEWLAEREEMLV